MSPTDHPPTPDVDELRFVEGSAGTALRGVVLGLVAVGAVLGYLVYAYFYLSVTVDEWPPEAAPALPLAAPALLLGVLLVTLAPAALAWRAAGRRRAVALALALAVVAATGAAVVAAGAVLLAAVGLEPSERAYDGIVVTLHVFHGVATVAGVVAAVVVAYESVRLGAQRWVTSAAVVVVVWWFYVVLGWAGVVAVVYGWPELA